ncbi:shikimate dehydrogenase family protein [Membranihabitans marinus]|uniref:shikimate dehydrogenase family protein n=1 Tax=Membranihabitans marinus TaxID=1227546 RepID=UPI001F3D35E5|nr:shikimate dehydrogenase [Membranihabitans marinus]
MKNLVLLGKKLGHTFSPSYFQNKFETEGIQGFDYSTLELDDIKKLPQALADNPSIIGFNVTIPYKQAVIPFLDELDVTSEAIGAVNTVQRFDGKLKGYNTDVIGFEQTLMAWKPTCVQSKALVLGTGGASKAVKYVLEKHQIPYYMVSSSGQAGALSYEELTAEVLRDHLLIVNTTPLGMYPKVETAPNLNYDLLTEDHCLYDLVYNPAETTFMIKGREQGASVKNGYDMLVAQAEASWQIWNEVL